ncbi:MAG: hypothetical protein ACI83D_000655 [Planctomycetota bacterium]|jgi:hypothetical protein
MIKVIDVLRNIIDADIELKNCLARNLVNYSSYARSIQKEVAQRAKKQVSAQSIVVALTRIQKELHTQAYLPEVDISQITMKSPVVELIYKNTGENLQMLSRVAKTASKAEAVFLSFSTSTKDIAIIASANLVDDISKLFPIAPHIEKKGLTAVSIRFREDLVSESGVGFSLMQRIATRGIVLDEVVSTYNEFTLVFDSRYLPEVLEVLQ